MGRNVRTSDKGATEHIHEVDSCYEVVALLPLQKVMAEISNSQLLMTPQMAGLSGRLCWSPWGPSWGCSWKGTATASFTDALRDSWAAGLHTFLLVVQGFSLPAWPSHEIAPVEHLKFSRGSSGIPKVQRGGCLALFRLVCRTAVMSPLLCSHSESKSQV